MGGVSSFNSQRFKEFEHAGWERSAAHYHELFGTITEQAIDPMLGAAAIRSGDRLLDAPCGSGGLSAAAAEGGAQVTGLDFSASMVADAMTVR